MKTKCKKFVTPERWQGSGGSKFHAGETEQTWLGLGTLHNNDKPGSHSGWALKRNIIFRQIGLYSYLIISEWQFKEI